MERRFTRSQWSSSACSSDTDSQDLYLEGGSKGLKIHRGDARGRSDRRTPRIPRRQCESSQRISRSITSCSQARLVHQLSRQTPPSGEERRDSSSLHVPASL